MNSEQKHCSWNKACACSHGSLLLIVIGRTSPCTVGPCARFLPTQCCVYEIKSHTSTEAHHSDGTHMRTCSHPPHPPRPEPLNIHCWSLPKIPQPSKWYSGQPCYDYTVLYSCLRVYCIFECWCLQSHRFLIVYKQTSREKMCPSVSRVTSSRSFSGLVEYPQTGRHSIALRPNNKLIVDDRTTCDTAHRRGRTVSTATPPITGLEIRGCVVMSVWGEGSEGKIQDKKHGRSI